MFPSSSNHDHFTFTNQAAMIGSSFTENENPSSSREHHPSPFFHFSDEPFLVDGNELFMNQFLSQHHILGCNSNPAAEAKIKMVSPVKATKRTSKKKNVGNGEKPAAPWKRAGKKDRHSKIYTAQGPRDRRMRLSLQIARKFFDLQDMLGFDKASKTIEWLFSKSKAAIKELTESLPSVKNSCTGGAKSLSSTSESEIVSVIKKSEDPGDQKSAPVNGKSLVAKPRGKTNRKLRKPIINPVVRDSRDKARARARERTMEKMKMRRLVKSKKCSGEANPSDLEQKGSSSPIHTAENFGSFSQEKNSSLTGAAEEEDSAVLHLPDHQIDSVSIIEKFLGITTSPRSSSIFDYTQNIEESSGANSQLKNPIYTLNWHNTENDKNRNSYCETTNKKVSISNLQAQNPGAIFEINPVVYMSICNARERNPKSDFKAFSNTHEQNPISIAMASSNIDSQTHFLDDQFSCNHIVDNKYCHLF